MVKVGENTGGLADMLQNVADFADEEIDNRLNLMLSMLAPVVLMFMGGLVAMILLAIYLPMFDLINAARSECRRAPWQATLDANNFVPELDPEGAPLTPRRSAEQRALDDAKRLAERCRLEFIDLTSFQPDQDSVPERSGRLDVPLQLSAVQERRRKARRRDRGPDERSRDGRALGILKMPVRAAVGTDSAIQELLKKSQSAQRVLEEASESFHMEIIREDDEGEETLSIDRLTDTSSPIIRLVDSAVYNALNRRASDIHIETRDEEVVIKYRIDGALTRAMKPIPKAHHSEIISRIKVMAELDIAEKRIPQDGRFRLKVKGRRIDFRVSIMPSIHGEDAVIRILDKESISERFTELRLDILGMADDEVKRIRRFIHEPYGMFLVTGPTGSGKDDDALRGALRDLQRRRQDHHHRRSGRVPAQRRHADPGQREERPHVLARTALDPASRPRQGHGR